MNKHHINPLDVALIVIDSFCGAGGVTQGFHNATVNGKRCVVVVIGINHDAKAIASHKENHPETIHFTEDFRKVNIQSLLPILEEARRKYPNAQVLFQMSAECTSHSIAKGGMSRDADSRSLPEYAYEYIRILQPDLILVENVKEFLQWGPLQIKVVHDKKGNALYCPLDKKERPETEEEILIRKAKGIKKFKRYNYLPVYIPVQERKGEFYNAWRDTIKNMGYHYDYRLLNAADFGAFTSRIRYFGLFAKNKENIVFPKPTHSKAGKHGMQKWKAVKDVLDMSDKGKSIFDRIKELATPTHERLYAGLIKHIAGGKDNFIVKYNSMQQNKTYVAPGVDAPCPTVTTQNRLGVCFISKAYSGDPYSKNISVNEPVGAITTVDHHQFISAYYGNGHNHSVESPSPTLTTKDRLGLVQSSFICKYYSGNPDTLTYGTDEPAHTIRTKDGQALFLCSYNYKDEPKGINSPCPTLLTKDRYSLACTSFIDLQYGNGTPSSINSPAATLTTNPKHQLVYCSWLQQTHFKNVGTSLNSPSPVITANRKWSYLINPQYASAGGSVDKPRFTLIARMDKRPPSIVNALTDTDELPSFIKLIDGVLVYEIYDTDTEIIRKIKEFMALYGIVDIKMRMLKIVELLLIMGFPADYILIGTQADKKKFIGNAVDCTQSQVIAESLSLNIFKQLRLVA